MGQNDKAKPFDPVWLRKDLDELIDAVSLPEPQKHFLRSRWLESIIWMERAAQRTRFRYYLLRAVVAVGAVVIPALVSLNVIGSAKDIVLWITFALSLVVGVSAALEGFFKLGERWRHYRRRVEGLKAEGWDFYRLGGRYEGQRDHEVAFELFAASVQAILALELDEFIADIAQAPEPRSTTPPGPAERGGSSRPAGD